MSYLLAELEIDRAIEEFLRARGANSLPQPIVESLDALPEDEDWDTSLRRAESYCFRQGEGETCAEMAARVVAKIGL